MRISYFTPVSSLLLCITDQTQLIIQGPKSQRSICPNRASQAAKSDGVRRGGRGSRSFRPDQGTRYDRSRDGQSQSGARRGQESREDVQGEQIAHSCTYEVRAGFTVFRYCHIVECYPCSRSVFLAAFYVILWSNFLTGEHRIRVDESQHTITEGKRSEREMVWWGHFLVRGPKGCLIMFVLP